MFKRRKNEFQPQENGVINRKNDHYLFLESDDVKKKQP